MTHPLQRTVGTAVAGAVLLLVAMPGRARAQTPTDSLTPAGAEYQFRGTLAGFERFLYGSRYRSLWAVPVAAPALPIDFHLADSLPRNGTAWVWTPDGGLWEFVPLDQDLVSSAPSALRQNLLPSTLQGLNPVRHPGAAPVVEVLAGALGVPVPVTALVRLVNTETDAEGGWLGYLVRAGRGGPTTREVLDSLRAGGGRDLDARAYLRDRLFDTFLGQWNVAPEQWQWRLDAVSGRWTPEPRYREFAFARFDGLLARLAGISLTGFVNFGSRYQSHLGVTPYQQTLDRQLLAVLDWSVWDSVASAQRTLLTDSVIDLAVAKLPPEYRSAGAAPLAAALRARRDNLNQAARRLYRLVNTEAALFGTPGADTVTVTRGRHGSMDITFRDGFHRFFAPGDTRAVGLYLDGGADAVVLAGPGGSGPLLDLAWQQGLEVTGARSSGRHTITYGGGPADRSLKVSPVPDSLPVPGVQDLDWSSPPPVPLHGTRTAPVPWFGANSDIGLLLGGGVTLTTYRIGHSPYYRKVQVRAGYTTELKRAALEMHAEFNRWHSPTTFTLDVGVPALTDLRFFGYGNTTSFNESAAYYQTTQREIYIYPAWHYRLGPHGQFAVGPMFKQVTTDTSQNDFISQDRPYGVPDFAQFGAEASVALDTRDAPAFARSGWHAVAGGSYYPVTFGAGNAFGSVRGSVATYLTPRGMDRLTLALRASARLTMGEVPVHEAAYVGGSSTLRGYRSGRYAGDAGAWFNSELRAELGTLAFVSPWRFGVLGIGDLGRVFYDTDNVDVWHASGGGGFWMALPDRSTGIVLTAVVSDEGTAFWFGSGFMF
ncbi:MAG TPA: BamA/TamA family outer membrane protein [Gemmatimonadales bacterium]|nr:BamA/TamA family outer membrane protein [Gemmatimonadales bacterium]